MRGLKQWSLISARFTCENSAGASLAIPAIDQLQGTQLISRSVGGEVAAGFTAEVDSAKGFQHLTNAPEGIMQTPLPDIQIEGDGLVRLTNASGSANFNNIILLVEVIAKREF
jgi:hypothetical protein